MGDDSLDALLKQRSGGRRSRLPGLKVADILTMPPEQQSLVNWLMRHYEATAQTLADNIHQELSQVATSLQDLTDQGFIKTLERNGNTYYRVKLAPKSGRQMPTDVWKVLDANSQQANVFISYSRRNKEFVQELHGALDATGREVWVDWENIPVAVDWWQEIQLGIELADTFLFVLSPDSTASKVCGQEIEEALKHNKRLVPVVCYDVQPDQVHPELARLNWIFLRPQDDFEKGFKDLLDALDQDLDYVRTHTRILVRALEWDRSDRDNSYLLRGADLERANHYLAQGKAQEPRPTALHHQYVLASAEVEAAEREVELRRQRQVVAGQQRWLQLVTAISVLAAALGVTSWALSKQAQTAQRAAEQAQLKALTQSSEALFVSDQRFEALLAATQAGHLFQTLDPNLQTDELRAQVMSSLQQALFWVQERNRLEGHTGTVWQVAFSPTEPKLVSASADGTVRIWGLDGQSLKVLECNGVPLLDLVFSPDGAHIVAVDSDGNAHLWDNTGNLETQWKAHEQPTRAVSFSPDGQFIATASEDATVKIWDSDRTLVRTLRGRQAGLKALFWTEEGRLIAGDEQGNVYLWNEAGELLTTFSEHSASVTALDVSPDGQFLASAGRDRQVNLYDLQTQTLVKAVTAHQGGVYNVSFTPNGERLITVGDDKLIRLWRLDGTLSETLVGHTGLVAALAVNPTGEFIATSGGDRAVRLWELQRDNLRVLQGHQGPVNSVALSPDSNQIASGGEDATVRIWNRSGTLLRSLEGHTGAITAVTYSPDGTQMATASSDSSARWWRNIDRGTPESVLLRGHFGGVNDIAFHPDGDLIATAGNDHQIRLWRPDGSLVTTIEAHRDGILSVEFSPDGQYLASSGWDHRIKIWAVDAIQTATPLTLEGHRGWVLDVVFSPDGQQLASASYDNTVRIWNVANGQLLETLEGHRDGVLAVTFSPSSQSIVTASNDNTLRIWNTSGTLLATLSGHTQGVRDVAVGDGGTFAASASSDGRVLIWEREGMDSIDALLNNSCQWLANYLEYNQQTDSELEQICETAAVKDSREAEATETLEDNPSAVPN